MNKKVVKIYDTAFAHEEYCGSKIGKNIPNKMVWDRFGNIDESDIVVFTDSSLYKVNYINKNCKKIAWLIEPPCVSNQNYDYIINNYEKFDIILTHQIKLCEISPKFKILPMWYSMVWPEKHGVYKKVKNLSIIASNKRDTIGHILRHDIIDLIVNKNIEIDLFGGLTSSGIGYKPIDDKSESLSPYRFSIIVENDKSPHYFSEKIIDCLLCGTIPIYWGADNIGEYFNINGFIIINSLDDISLILDNLNEETYGTMIQFIEENYKIASKYLTVEDYMYDRYLDDIIGSSNIGF